MLVVYDFGRNNILLDPLNDRKEGTIKTAWYLRNDTLSNGGGMKEIYLLDNEA